MIQSYFDAEPYDVHDYNTKTEILEPIHLYELCEEAAVPVLTP